MSTDVKGMNSDIAQLENYIGHKCVAGVKVYGGWGATLCATSGTFLRLCVLCVIHIVLC